MENNTKVKKPFYKRWWFIVIVAIVVLGAIGNMLNEDDKPQDAQKTDAPNTANQGSQIKDDSKDNTSQDKKEDTNTEKIISAVGGSITTKNFIITLEEFNVLKGSEFNKPTDEKQFVELVLVIENISKNDYSVSSLLMFNAYEDSFSINESISAQIANDAYKTMDGELAAGKKLKGKLAYEISENWKELEIDIDLTKLSFSTDGEIKIKLKNE